MKYDPTRIEDKIKAQAKFSFFLDNNKKFELKEIKNKRTISQNSSLHLYFDFIAEWLNELGVEFTYNGIKGVELSTMYTPHIVKEMIWKPIQLTLFKTDSTTKLTTDNMNKIIDILTKFFAEKGINLQFPSIESLTNK